MKCTHDMEGDERATKFRFKSRSTSSRDYDEAEPIATPRKRRHHHSHHHRHKRRKTTPPPLDDPSAYDDSTSKLPPEAAFRESLFDALGDDEGAQFWQGVYGQPIHTYPNTYVDEDTGELERMTEDEYAQYVRRRMWEKSWEGIEAAQEEKRSEERDRRKKQSDGVDDKPDKLYNGVFNFEVEESLRRGERRRQAKRWKALWLHYLKQWEDLQQLAQRPPTEENEREQLYLRNQIAWPVESGKRQDVAPEEIEKFINSGTKHAEPSLDSEKALVSALKVERIRWHPDKVQQRFGRFDVDEKTMKGVTAVFQVFDRMWNERKEKY